MKNSKTRRAAVIGAGLSGLSAAYHLIKAGWEVKVFESSDHVGGRVQTDAVDGFLIDTGASAIAESYRFYVALAKELGIGDQIEAAPACVGIYREGKLHELNLEKPLSLAFTGILSFGAKLRMFRMMKDIAVARFRGQLDFSDMSKAAPLDTETAEQYAVRVLGQEGADYFASPIVRVMLIADTDKISKVELLSGVANIMTTRISALKGGQGRLPKLLAEKVNPSLNHAVEQVSEKEDGVEVRYLDPQGTEHTDHFDACVVCCPLPDAARICVDRKSQELLSPINEGMSYTKSITVALAFESRPDSGAFLVHMPACEDPDVALLFMDHNKCSDRAPEGKGLIDCHWETDAAARVMHLSDQEIADRSLDTVYRVFPELKGQYMFAHVTRWERALPCTSIGAYQLIGDFNKNMDLRSRVQFASDYMNAAGQNTATELGARAAERLNDLPL